ncbi:hypothetical protein [Flavobacterium sp. I3-2]|uniref:hypothetical protein n=1 Tax=Flavobacterium sp. I3-2 TaxID=2748319 RepID=UPI0015A96692|nr:hypothetical protein [Flavobacterium sp. I3-2]
MKSNKFLLLLLVFITLISCSGSDTYQGQWKATNPNGNQVDINFELDSFSVKDTLGNFREYNYSQNSIKTSNGIKTYGIKLADGRGYQIHFPNATTDDIAIIMDENGNVIYTLGRKEYMLYEDIYKLN